MWNGKKNEEDKMKRQNPAQNKYNFIKYRNEWQQFTWIVVVRLDATPPSYTWAKIYNLWCIRYFNSNLNLITNMVYHCTRYLLCSSSTTFSTGWETRSTIIVSICYPNNNRLLVLTLPCLRSYLIWFSSGIFIILEKISKIIPVHCSVKLLFASPYNVVQT